MQIVARRLGDVSVFHPCILPIVNYSITKARKKPRGKYMGENLDSDAYCLAYTITHWANAVPSEQILCCCTHLSNLVHICSRK